MKLIDSHKHYIFEIGWDPADDLGQLIAQTPVAPDRMHKMDGGKYMSYADQNLLVFLHKLGVRKLRGRHDTD